MQPGQYEFDTLYRACCDHVRSEGRTPARRQMLGIQLSGNARLDSRRTGVGRMYWLKEDA